VKYVVAYPRSEWPGQGLVEPPAGATLSELDIMPPYGATVAGNVLRSLAGCDFLGVLDEYTLTRPMDECLDHLYLSYPNEPVTVFFSTYVFNNDRVAHLAGYLKRRWNNAVVVLGGPFADYFQNNRYIDAVIVGDAETGIPEYLRTQATFLIAKPADLTLGPIDFTVINKEKSYSQGVANSMRGCRYRLVDGGGCVFCSMRRSAIRLRSPELVLKEIAKEAQDLSTDWFYDGADSFAISKRWLHEYASMRNELIHDGFEGLRDLKIFAYANPSDVTDTEVPRLLYECGVRRVFLGIESADEDVLQAIGKPHASVEANVRALEMFRGTGIEVRFGIVLGVRDGKSSLKRTYDFLRTLPTFSGVRIVSIVLSLVLVLPGSLLYQELAQNRVGLDNERFSAVQAIDTQLRSGGGITKKQINFLSKAYVEAVCGLSFETLLEWKRMMDDLLISQGMGIWTFGGF
jgi:radical SAM superfamily enzyme YgiQ (UPF0313 family)